MFSTYALYMSPPSTTLNSHSISLMCLCSNPALPPACDGTGIHVLDNLDLQTDKSQTLPRLHILAKPEIITIITTYFLLLLLFLAREFRVQTSVFLASLEAQVSRAMLGLWGHDGWVCAAAVPYKGMELSISPQGPPRLLLSFPFPACSLSPFAFAALL